MNIFSEPTFQTKTEKDTFQSTILQNHEIDSNIFYATQMKKVDGYTRLVNITRYAKDIRPSFKLIS